MKVAPSALHISLALRERAGVRETVMAAATYILRGGADAMAVSCTAPASGHRLAAASRKGYLAHKSRLRFCPAARSLCGMKESLLEVYYGQILDSVIAL
jgi:hypothetical protein